MTVKLWLIGTCKHTINDEQITLTGNKILALIAYLAIERGLHNREVLATLFWGESTQDRAMNNLRQFLYKLRILLPDGMLLSNRLTVGIPLEADLWTDVAQLQRLANAKSPDTQELINLVEELTGQFMEGINLLDAPEFDAWQLQKRHQVQGDVQEVLRYLIVDAQEKANYEDAIKWAEHLVKTDLFNVEHHRLLVQLYTEGRWSSAKIHQYHTIVDALMRQSNSQPIPEAQQLYHDVLKENSQFGTQATAIKSIYPPRPLMTVGREDDLRQLLPKLQSNRVVAIQGWPGVGKSTLAALLAHDSEIAQLFPDGILWTALEQDASPVKNLRQWAQVLGLADDRARIDVITIRLRQYLQEKRMLMIVDDVWDASALEHFQIIGEQSALVFTTRENDIARAVTQLPDEVYRLNILSQEDALKLMKQLAPGVVGSHPDEVATLIHELEGLPLALQVAGRLLQAEYEMGWSIVDLLAELHEGMPLLKAQAPQNRLGASYDIPPTVVALLAQSTNRLSDDYRLRFAALGVFAPKPATFSEKALATIWQVDDPRDTIRLFVGRGLMESVGNGRFQVHALLITHARSLFALQ